MFVVPNVYTTHVAKASTCSASGSVRAGFPLSVTTSRSSGSCASISASNSGHAEAAPAIPRVGQSAYGSLATSQSTFSHVQISFSSGAVSCSSLSLTPTLNTQSTEHKAFLSPITLILNLKHDHMYNPLDNGVKQRICLNTQFMVSQY